MRRVLLLLLLLTLPLSAATFESHDGTTLYYEIVGKGEPVLLLSGGPGFSPEYLRPIAEKLRDKYSFVLFHQRGTGKSVVEKLDGKLALPSLVGDLEALRKELKLEKLTLAGHSFGGILSMMYARQHPDRIRALALIDAGGPTLESVPKFNTNLTARTTAEDAALVRKWSDPETVKANPRLAMTERMKARTPPYFHDRSKAHLLTDKMTEDSFHDGVFWGIVMQMMALDIREGLEKVKAPVLVIHGRQDPLESAEEVHATFPGSKLVMLDEAGHFPWLEQGEKFYAALDGFLREVR
ncbi:MAG TPA: alpha/beta hydrolase [Thermoanaerobaculia bacterium]|nr:alpha/beta hydrolase [Thermoanaerobaculia bacterium]